MQKYNSDSELLESILGVPTTAEQYKEMAQLLFDLYVTEQKKRLVQFKSKTGETHYSTEEAGKGYLKNSKYVITTFQLMKHVQGKATYGVFAGAELSKFLCFDVDYGNWEASEIWVKRIINSLKRHGIKKEQIHVSFSGKKGFHVDLFFDKALQVKTLQLFYEHVVSDIDGDIHKIEFRPTSTQGVKLPLGIHQDTQTQCYFVNYDTFDIVDYLSDKRSIEYLKQAKTNRIDAHRFIEVCKKLKPTLNTIAVEHKHTGQAEKLISKAQNNIDKTFQSVSDKLTYCKHLLATRQLMYSGSRHNATLLIAQYIKEQGTERDAAVNEVKAFIEEAYRNDRSKFSEETTLGYAVAEAERLTSLVYEREYSLYNTGRKEWELYESEMTYILEKVNTMSEKRKQPFIQLLFAFLMESKKHATKSNDYVFYTTYKQLAKYGCDSNEGRIKKQIVKLVELGVLEIAKVTERIGTKNTPYYYKVHIPKEASDNNKLVITSESVKEDKKIDTVIATLLAEEKASKLVSKKVYYERLRPVYETA